MSLAGAPRRTLLAVTAAALLGACAAPSGEAATAAGFAGYQWSVTSISHDGKTVPVSQKYAVSLLFAPDGHFGANDSVNFSTSTYRVTPDGFTTSGAISTAAGYVGRDPVVLLAISAISAVSSEATASADVSGGALTVVAGGYTLVAEKTGPQGEL
jgi:hypothetical protein